MKRCGRCQKEKLELEFTKSHQTQDGLHGWCRLCRREADPAYDNDSDAARKRKRQWREQHARPCIACGKPVLPTGGEQVKADAVKCRDCWNKARHRDASLKTEAMLNLRLQGKSNIEIGQIMRCSPSSVATQLQRPRVERFPELIERYVPAPYVLRGKREEE